MRDRETLGSAGLIAVTSALAVTLWCARRKARRTPPNGRAARSVAALHPGKPLEVHAAQRLNRSSGLLAASVLADSALEHYRGAFQNRAMFAPLAASLLSLLAGGHGLQDERRGAHRLRHIVYWGAAGTGLLGTAFHLYNVGSRPGGWTWPNLFYGAPIGAPAALILSGLLGACAEQVRDAAPGREPSVFGLPAGRGLAAVVAAGLLGTTGEAGLLHFRGAFHSPAMWLPVTLPPAGAALLGQAAVGSVRRNRWFTRVWLRATALIGFGGSAFHAYGVSRNMGGWRNWRQNILNGPPLPAPPSFAGLALAGLAALLLLEDEPDVR